MLAELEEERLFSVAEDATEKPVVMLKRTMWLLEKQCANHEPTFTWNHVII